MSAEFPENANIVHMTSSIHPPVINYTSGVLQTITEETMHHWT